MSLLNGDIFDDDDFPVGSRSVLDWFYQVYSSDGHNRAAFDCLSVIENPDPSGPQYTLLLTEGQVCLRSSEVAGDEEYMHADDSSTENDSSDEEYSSSDDDKGSIIHLVLHFKVIGSDKLQNSLSI